MSYGLVRAFHFYCSGMTPEMFTKGPARRTRGLLTISTAATIAYRQKAWFLRSLSLVLGPVILPFIIWFTLDLPSKIRALPKTQDVDIVHLSLAGVVVYLHLITPLLLFRESCPCSLLV
jgi:hypothetical protein